MLTDRRLRRTEGAPALGLECAQDGVTLAGVSLLRKHGTGFESRNPVEIALLVEAACGRDVDPTAVSRSLDVIAKALNQGDLGRAQIAAALVRVEDLDPEAAVRVAQADEILAKQNFNPEEPRDWRGRWTSNGGVGPTKPASRKRPPNSAPRPSRMKPAVRVGGRRSTPAPSQGAVSNQLASLQSLHLRLESEFDNLGPVEFSKQVTQFGLWLGGEGSKLNPEQRRDARVQYDFLQDRLSFWLGYKYMPPRAHDNLLSAALFLYQGAVNGGLVPVGGPHGGLPESYVEAGVAAMAYDGPGPFAPSRRLNLDLESEELPRVPVSPPRDMGEVGGVAPISIARIIWGRGIGDQGEPLEYYLMLRIPGLRKLLANSKTFDLFNDAESRAISVKTLDTLTAFYARRPSNVYSRLAKYVDQAADYRARPGLKADLDSDDIRSMEIQLAVPELTSPEQWQQIQRAMAYGQSRGVPIVVTRIRGYE